jgi:hypothetical protein
MSAPLSRQIEYVLDRPNFRNDLRISSILSHVGQDPSSSASDWHKLGLRINSMLHANQDVAKGLQLALEMAQEIPWESVLPYVSHWISSALTHFSLATSDAIALLSHLLGTGAKDKLEYWRNVASINVPKYAIALTQALDADEELSDDALVSDRRAEYGVSSQGMVLSLFLPP